MNQARLLVSLAQTFENEMSTFINHVVLPAVAPVAVVGLYFTPVSLFGCVNRGLMALAIVFLSAIAASVTIGIALRTRMKNEASSGWWIVSTIILTLPLILVVGPLG